MTVKELKDVKSDSQTTTKEVRLQLGCCDRKMPGFINVDIRPEQNPDVLCDIAKINKKFQDVDLIYSSHVLEHFKRDEFMDVLQEWYNTLKDGGTLRLSVPCMEAAAKYYLETGDLNRMLCGLLYGDQGGPYCYHYHIWDFKTLSKNLKDVGFKMVQRWDWREVDHSYIDDHSQAYLPHMDKLNGRLMSLNVEAIK